MRFASVMAIALVAGLLVPADAQRARRRPAPPAAPQPVGPEYIGTIEAVVGSVRINLERVEPTFKVTTKGVIFGKAQVLSLVPGERSTIRFAPNTAIEFVTRVENQDLEPIAYVSLYRMKVEKKSRSLKLAQAGGVAGGGTQTDTEQKVEMSGVKYGPRFYRLKPIAALPKGEYMIRAGAGGVAYMFGID